METPVTFFELEDNSMEAVSNMVFAMQRSPGEVTGAREPLESQRAGGDGQVSPVKPARDEYIPEGKREAAGLYRPGRDENGEPKIYFDDPNATDDPPEEPGADGPKRRSPADRAETCTGSTDKVDREIEKLKKEQRELERRLASEKDGAKIKELEKKLAEIENELAQKDNGAYRRRHTVFS